MNNGRTNIWLCKAFALVLILNIFGISKGFAQPDTIYFNTEVLSGFNLLIIKGIINITQFYNAIGLDDWTEG